MKRWMLGGFIGAFVGVSIYLYMTKKPATQPVPAQTAPAATKPVTTVEPVVLAQVVDVLDLDPLLDPPAKVTMGVPFDADPVTVPVSVPAAQDRIPPAVD